MIKIIYTCLLVFTCGTTLAKPDSGIRWSVRGFGTFNLGGTSTDKIGFYRSNIQANALTRSLGVTTDSRLGLQLDLQINNSFHAAIQWAARDHVGDFFEQNLDWAFIRWNYSDTTVLKVGRLGADLFLLSDYRNVGYSYPWIRPPHEFYSNLALYHFDGFDFSQSFYLGDNLLTLKFFAGYSFNQVPTAFSEIVDLESPLTGLSIKFETGHWLMRAGYSYLRLVTDVPNEELVSAINTPLVNIAMPGISQIAPYLSLKNTNSHFFSLGASYDDGNWLIQTETSYIDTETRFFPDVLSAYLSVGKRFSNVTLYTLFGISHSFEKYIKVPTPVFPSFELDFLHQVIDRAINKNGVDEKSISLGLRWDFYDNIAFKTQWSHYWLGSNGTQYWKDLSSKEKSTQVDVWSLGIDFVF